MSRKGRCLRVGQHAVTDYGGRTIRVKIVEADYTRRHGHSQSGIMFRVDKPLSGDAKHSWYDADWFDPAPPLPSTCDMFD